MYIQDQVKSAITRIQSVKTVKIQEKPVFSIQNIASIHNVDISSIFRRLSSEWRGYFIRDVHYFDRTYRTQVGNSPKTEILFTEMGYTVLAQKMQSISPASLAIMEVVIEHYFRRELLENESRPNKSVSNPVSGNSESSDLSTPLVFSDNGKLFTTSRLIARKFGKEHKNVIRDIKTLEMDEEFGRLNFEPSSYLNEQNKEQPEYRISRDGFVFLVMGFTGKQAAKFKIEYINAFNEMENRLREKTQSGLPNFEDPVEAANAWIQQYQQKKLAEKAMNEQKEIVKEQTRQLNQQEPLVRFAETVYGSADSIDIGTYAKTLKLGPNKLFQWLRDHKFIFEREHRNVPYQQYVDSGVFELSTRKMIHPKDHAEQVYTVILVTGKGQLFLFERLKASGILKSTQQFQPSFPLK